MTLTESPLDRAVLATRAALFDAGAPEPDVLLFLGTGLGALRSHLQGVSEITIGPAAPRCWRGRKIVHGRLGKGRLWMIEDAPEDLEEEGPAWQRAFPIWLATAAGAQLGIVTSAGVSLPSEEPLDPASLAIVTDHINLSGTTPLLGLGETALGPLFPDQTTLQHDGLRSRAHAVARSEGLHLRDAVAACTKGPSLDTKAELQWLAGTGAEVGVQGLADPLLAAAHSGLGLVTLVAVTDDGKRPLRMAELVERSERTAPALEDLIVQLLPAVINEAHHWAAEERGDEDEEEDL